MGSKCVSCTWQGKPELVSPSAPGSWLWPNGICFTSQKKAVLDEEHRQRNISTSSKELQLQTKQPWQFSLRKTCTAHMLCCCSVPTSPCSKSWPSDIHRKPQTTAFQGLASSVLYSSTLYFPTKFNTFFPAKAIWASDFTSRSDSLSIAQPITFTAMSCPVPGRPWFVISATFLRPAKHIPPKGWRAQEVVSCLGQFLISFQPPQHSWCVALGLFGLGRRERERGMNREEPHTGIYIP